MTIDDLSNNKTKTNMSNHKIKNYEKKFKIMENWIQTLEEIHEKDMKLVDACRAFLKAEQMKNKALEEEMTELSSRNQVLVKHRPMSIASPYLPIFFLLFIIHFFCPLL